MKHYRCSRYFIDQTRAVRISNTAKLLPSHCKMPTISEDDNTVVAAAEIMEKINEKLDAKDKITHKKVIQQLTCIITRFTFIGCLLSAPTFGIRGLRLWEKDPNISGKKRKRSSIRSKVFLFEVCASLF